MSVLSLEELAAGLRPGTVLAGLDLGTKTIGVAISDLGLSLATPREVVRRVKFGKDADRLLALLERERVGGCIIGLPVNMDGSEGPRAQATRAFVRNMAGRTELGFTFWDERLSTVAAERALLEMDVSRKKRADRIDAAAAAFILQGALDRLSSLSADGSP
jgi:putative Holliday junction resolvase